MPRSKSCTARRISARHKSVWRQPTRQSRARRSLRKRTRTQRGGGQYSRTVMPIKYYGGEDTKAYGAPSGRTSFDTFYDRSVPTRFGGSAPDLGGGYRGPNLVPGGMSEAFAVTGIQTGGGRHRTSTKITKRMRKRISQKHATYSLSKTTRNRCSAIVKGFLHSVKQDADVQTFLSQRLKKATKLLYKQLIRDFLRGPRPSINAQLEDIALRSNVQIVCISEDTNEANLKKLKDKCLAAHKENRTPVVAFVYLYQNADLHNDDYTYVIQKDKDRAVSGLKYNEQRALTVTNTNKYRTASFLSALYSLQELEYIRIYIWERSLQKNTTDGHLYSFPISDMRTMINTQYQTFRSTIGLASSPLSAWGEDKVGCPSKQQNMTVETSARQGLSSFLKGKGGVRTTFMVEEKTNQLSPFKRENTKYTKYAYYSFGGIANGKAGAFDLVCDHLGITKDNREKFDADTVEDLFAEELIG